MASKYVRMLSGLVALVALSTAMVGLAGNVPAERASAGEDTCAAGGSGSEPGLTGSADDPDLTQKGCEDCKKKYQECLETARQDYNQLLEECRRDFKDNPMGRAACFKAAAEAYQAMVAACKAAFEACIDACKGG